MPENRVETSEKDVCFSKTMRFPNSGQDPQFVVAQFYGVLAQIWSPTRGNQILLRSENALHLRRALLCIA